MSSVINDHPGLVEMEHVIKFWGAGTMRTFRPIWVAEELGLSYEHLAFGPRTGETQTAEYTKLNPKQKIPYFADQHVKLSESVAISRYLIEAYGSLETISLPATIQERAKEDEWVCYIYGELDETSLYVMRRHRDLHKIFGEAPQAVESSKAYANKHFAVVAEYMAGREFVLGDRLGLADILLVSCIDWANHYGFDLDEALTSYQQRLAQRDAYQRAFATNYAGAL